MLKIHTWHRKIDLYKENSLFVIGLLMITMSFYVGLPLLESENLEASYHIPVVKSLESIILDKSEKYSLDPKIVKAVISHESKWNRYALGKDGDTGLMQVMLYNMTEEEKKNPYDLENNIEAGTRYLSKCFQKYGDLDKSLSCYNRGLNGKYNKIYVEKVKKELKKFKY